jgi:magnesium chelatase subunit D
LIETLRTAAPWQALRRRERAVSDESQIIVRRDDLRVARRVACSETTIVFVVDASGSAALNRLAEVKGAVELVLADCYVRRDRVALIAFRGTTAEVILPPTRSLLRAKRALAGQPGGGGTPLATAIDAAVLLAVNEQRRGIAPMLVFLTDGHGNIARSGQPGRAAAEADALAAARAVRVASLGALVVDIAPRPQERARQLATAMGARYHPLPSVEATALSRAVLASSQDASNLRRAP